MKKRGKKSKCKVGKEVKREGQGDNYERTRKKEEGKVQFLIEVASASGWQQHQKVEGRALLAAHGGHFVHDDGVFLIRREYWLCEGGGELMTGEVMPRSPASCCAGCFNCIRGK